MLFVVLTALVTPARADRVAQVSGSCVMPVASGSRGLGPAPGDGLALVDTFTRLLHLVDRDCTPVSTLDLSARGVVAPTGVAYDDSVGFAVADGALAAVLFMDAGGGVTGSCTLAGEVQGVAYDPVTGGFAVLDTPARRISLIDPTEQGGGPCRVRDDLRFPAEADGARDLTVDASTGTFVLVDETDERLYFVERSGVIVEELRFLGSDVDANTPRGVTWSGGSGFTVYDDTDRTLVHFTAETRVERVCTLPGAQGIATRPTGELLVTDDSAVMQVLDATDCAPLSDVALPTSARHIEALPSTGQVAVIAPGGQEVHFVTPGGAIASTCDLSNSAPSPASLAWMDGHGWLVVASWRGEHWVAIDEDCEVVHSGAVRPLAPAGTPIDTGGLTWHPGRGALVVATEDRDMLLGTFDGSPIQRINLNTPDGVLRGAAIDPDHPDGLLVLDADGGVWRVSPDLAPPTSLSGHFTGVDAEAWLLEREAGRFTGTLRFGAATIPVFGQVADGAGSLVFAGVSPSGKPVATTVAVSPDGSTLSLPGSLGDLSRSL